MKAYNNKLWWISTYIWCWGEAVHRSEGLLISYLLIVLDHSKIVVRSLLAISRFEVLLADTGLSLSCVGLDCAFHLSLLGYSFHSTIKVDRHFLSRSKGALRSQVASMVLFRSQQVAVAFVIAFLVMVKHVVSLGEDV